MVDLTTLQALPNFPYKIIFLVHFMFTSLSAMGHWASNGYLFYNIILVLLILWSMQQSTTQSCESIQLAFLVNICAIVLDIFYLAFCYPDSYRAAERFSAALAILHLVARPFTILYMVKIMRDRGEEPSILGGIFPPAPARATSYEDIDRNQAPPPNQSSYDFSTAQQI